MGLGQTIQAIAFLYSMQLFVSVPLSICINWEREFETRTPDFLIGCHPPRRQRFASRHSRWGCRSKRKPSKFRFSSVKFYELLTTYELCSIGATLLEFVEWAV
jgi:SNF2 family DNA or RNA helicase